MSLHLQRAGVRPATLADGTTAYLTAYVVQVEWDGVPRVDICLAAEGGSLIGMRMLYGHEVTLRVVAGGDVTTRPVLP